jgi:hypothetical protein
VGHAATKNLVIPDAQGVRTPEGNSDAIVKGQEGVASGGVFDHGTQEEDGPGTWEALVSPQGDRRLGEPVDDLRRSARRQSRGSSGEG